MSILSSISILGWCEVFSNIAVLVALCGESHWGLKRLIPNNSKGATSVKRRREKLKKKFEFLLIIGIAGEVGCLPMSLKESADANKAAGIAKVEAGKANERAALVDSNNLMLQARVLALTAQIQETTNNLAIVGKIANETHDLLGDSNTTERLNETKNALKNANQVATDIRSIVVNSNLGALESKLRQLKLKPLDERIRNALDSLDQKILPALKYGITNFGGWMPQAKLDALTQICTDPESAQYITFLPVGTNAGTAFGPNGVSVFSEFDLSTNLLGTTKLESDIESHLRKISPEQKTKLLALTAGQFPKPGVVQVAFLATNFESHIFAKQIVDELAACNFKPTLMSLSPKFGPVAK
jgi:hypothetical protein